MYGLSLCHRMSFGWISLQKVVVSYFPLTTIISMTKMHLIKKILRDIFLLNGANGLIMTSSHWFMSSQCVHSSEELCLCGLDDNSIANSTENSRKTLFRWENINSLCIMKKGNCTKYHIFTLTSDNWIIIDNINITQLSTKKSIQFKEML